MKGLPWQDYEIGDVVILFDYMRVTTAVIVEKVSNGYVAYAADGSGICITQDSIMLKRLCDADPEWARLHKIRVAKEQEARDAMCAVLNHGERQAEKYYDICQKFAKEIAAEINKAMDAEG